MPVADKYPSIRDKGRYRIQNVDTETFLERKGTDVVLRPLKKTSDNQEWIFMKKKNNVYEIEPATNPNRVLIGDISGGSAGNSTFPLVLEQKPIQGTNIGQSWTLYTASPLDDQLYIVSEELRTKRVNNYLVFVNDGDVVIGPDRQVKADQEFHKLDKGEDYAWRLVEVTPASLPDGDTNGKYRIRTLNGMAIHSLPDRDTLSIKNQNRGDHRAWNIKDLGNGNCTIFNVEKKKYLATKLVSDIWEPFLADSAPLALESTGSTADQEKESAPWRIEAMSDYTWSIYVWRGTNRQVFQGKEKLSLSLKDDTAILKPWKKAHNQIWMIEPTDVPVTSSNVIVPALLMNTAYKFISHGKSAPFEVYRDKAGLPHYELGYDGNGYYSRTGRYLTSTGPLYMEPKPLGQEGEVFIYLFLDSVKYYFALKADIARVSMVQYPWTIEPAPTQGYFLYVTHIYETPLGDRSCTPEASFVLTVK